MLGETFLQDLAIVMIVAGLVTMLFHGLKQPVVLGYILAGVLIGPHLIPLIPNHANVQTLSELGVIFLLFSLGLEFNLRKLRTTGVAALIAATLKIVVMLWAGYQIGTVAGWNRMNSLFLGAILSISSTTIIIKTLQDLRKSRESFAEVIYGILIVEDILAILMIAMLSGFAKSGSLPTADVFMILLRLGVFLVAVLVVGLLAVPRLLNYVSRFKSDEMLLVSVLGLCFGLSLLAAKLNFSVALGAFLMGAIIAESHAIGRIELLLRPVRDLFSAVFFVSIGMQIDPRLLLSHWGVILVISVAMVIGKSLACAFGAFVAGNDRASALRIGMALVPIGEFSFIIATLGLSLNVAGDFLYPIAVSISAVTILLMPYMLRSADLLVGWVDRTTPSFGNFLDIYTNWIGQLRTTKSNNIALTLVRKWALQMALNVVLISGIFLSAPYFRHKTLIWWPHIPGGAKSLNSLFWMIAMILSLPMIIAVFRKLQATGMLLAEVSVTRTAGGARTDALRTIVSTIILIAGSLALSQIILMLSSAILPSWDILFVLVLLIILTAIILRRPFIRMYATAQIALRETFLHPAPLRTHSMEESLLSKGSELASVHILQNSIAVGKPISELELRSKTGVSIVGIERGDASIVNPDPNEKIRAGDQLLILGTREQLHAASAFLD